MTISAEGDITLDPPEILPCFGTFDPPAFTISYGDVVVRSSFSSTSKISWDDRDNAYSTLMFRTNSCSCSRDCCSSSNLMQDLDKSSSSLLSPLQGDEDIRDVESKVLSRDVL